MSNLSTTEYSLKKREALLSTLFSSAARTAVLKALLVDPARAYYQRQVEAATGLPLRAVQRELERLTGARLLYRHQEGNRAYYQADTDSLFYPELRAMVLKVCEPRQRLRAVLAAEPSVRLAFLDGSGARVLLVGHGAARPEPAHVDGFEVESMSSREFTASLHEPSLAPFLREGVDLFGRRDDIIWRRIEEAGHTVAKGEGVP